MPSRARLHGSPALNVLSPFPACHVVFFCNASWDERSLCTQCIDVAFGEEDAPARLLHDTGVLGNRSAPRQYPHLVCMQRAAAARACGLQLCFAVRVRDVANMSSLKTEGHPVFPSTCPSPPATLLTWLPTWQNTSYTPSSGLMILELPSPRSCTAPCRSAGTQ